MQNNIHTKAHIAPTARITGSTIGKNAKIMGVVEGSRIDDHALVTATGQALNGTHLEASSQIDGKVSDSHIGIYTRISETAVMESAKVGEYGYIAGTVRHSAIGRRASIRETALITDNSTVGASVRVAGHVHSSTLGNRVRVGEKSAINGCTIGDNTIIEAEEPVINATIGADVTLMPTAKLGQGVTVGNHSWVEGNVADNVTLPDHMFIDTATTASIDPKRITMGNAVLHITDNHLTMQREKANNQADITTLTHEEWRTLTQPDDIGFIQRLGMNAADRGKLNRHELFFKHREDIMTHVEAHRAALEHSQVHTFRTEQAAQRNQEAAPELSVVEKTR